MTSSEHPRIPTQCTECIKRAPGAFCALPESALSSLEKIKTTNHYPRGSTLFMEGQPTKGVYLLCSGRVKLSSYSEEGKAIILRVAEPGEILGIYAAISGTSHETTAQVTNDCRAGFIKKRDFLELLQTHHAAALNALKQLSNSYRAAHEQICSLGLSLSTGDKLARLLLQWSERSDDARVRISPTFTHGEMAEMIGSSRETVTRLLKDFRDRDLITFSRKELWVLDQKKLRHAIGSKHRNGHSNGNGNGNGHGHESV